MGKAGKALWYTDNNTKVNPRPDKITKKQAAKVVKEYNAAFATSTE